MIKNFFLNLNSHKVRYLLISGQASVVYGAATFSEDIDLWVEPIETNWKKLLQVLSQMKAQTYKLTPPINQKFITNSHGFHFVLSNSIPWFLDIMGIVPRLKSFKTAFKNVNYTETDWGKLPVVGLRDLVELKKTQRLGDYPVISNLVRKEYEQLLTTKINQKDWKWILTNSYDIDDLLYYIQNNRLAYKIAVKLKRACMPDCINILNNPLKKEKYFKSASLRIAEEIEIQRQNDRNYWKPVIEELKLLNRTNQLLVIGTKVNPCI